MQSGCTGVLIVKSGACDSLSDSHFTHRLMGIIAHKMYDQFESEIGGHQGLLRLLDIRYESFNTCGGALNLCGGGILASSLKERQERFGVNRLPKMKQKDLWTFIRESVEEDRILQLLFASAFLSIVLGLTTPNYREGKVDLSTGWVEGAAIFISIFIVVTLNAANNYKRQEQFAHVIEREGQSRQAVLVWRYESNTVDGSLVLKPMEVQSENIVVGDVVQITSGMELTFDAILFDNCHVVCDECSVTGENEEVVKDAKHDPFLISGSSVLDGSSSAVAVVCAVGKRSFAGEIAMAIQNTEKKSTPLQGQLEMLAQRIGKLGLSAAILTFVALFLKETFHVLLYGSPFFAMKFFENLTTAIAIVVVAVPEGLPLSVAISLAYSMRRMLQDGNLVRHLAACETMGGATVLCTDKTGTITCSNMTLSQVFFEGRTHARATDTSGSVLNTWSKPFLNTSSPTSAKLLMDCVVSNSLDPDIGRARNKTAEALMQLISNTAVSAKGNHISNFSYDVSSMLATMRDRSSCARFPFNSLKKQSTTIVKLPNGDLREYVVGAPEIILAKCQNTMMENGHLEPLNYECRMYYENILEVYARSGFRTLCCAYGDSKPPEGKSMPLAPFDSATNLLAVMALEESIRPEVPRALEICARAGLRVIMITGDSLLTSLNIAARCGLFKKKVFPDIDAYESCLASSSVDVLIKDGYVIDGATFRSLSDKQLLDQFIGSLLVLARANPLDKKRVLHLLKLYDPQAVVAVTGDGTNDAPALKMSDVGFAMNSGSDVAKRASDILLLNDDFTGMVKATMWGRNVRDNIRKFLQFQLTVNCVACLLSFCGALINEQNLSPLKPVQLLWLNLIMDTLAALALATELPSESTVLTRPPEARNAPVILPSMWFQMATQGSFQLLSQLYLLSSGYRMFITEGNSVAHRTVSVEYFSPKHLSIVFNVFVLMQVMNFFNARLLDRGEKFFGRCGDSLGLLTIVFLIVMLQVCIIQYGGRFMSTVPLSAHEWLLCTLYASGSLLVGAVSRWWWWGGVGGGMQGDSGGSSVDGLPSIWNFLFRFYQRIHTKKQRDEERV